MSLIPVQLRETNSPAPQPHTRAIPLSFRHRPFPYIFFSLSKSRIELLAAIVSMLRIESMISKSTTESLSEAQG